MKKYICMILSLVLILSLTSTGIYAGSYDNHLFDIQISTDKQTYGISDTAVITVTVKNISRRPIGGVGVSVCADSYLLVQGGKSAFDVGELDKGESVNFSFKAVVNMKTNGLKFFDKLSLFFKQLFKKYTSLTQYVPEHKNHESAEFEIVHSYIKIPVTVNAWYTAFTSQELSDMKKVDECLAESENINDGLDSLLNLGLISNIVNSNGINWFTYSNGTLGGVMTDSFSDTSDDNSQAGGTVTEISDAQLEIYDKYDIGKALILYSFNYPSDMPYQNYRRPFYDSKDSTSLVNQWGMNQVMTDVDDDVTVRDIKNIDESYDIVCFSGHGSTLGNTPAMCLTEMATNENKQEYADDLVNKRIVTVTYDGGTYYWVFPSIFECYGSDGLDDKLVFFQCCEAFGEGDVVDSQFADNVVNAGADAAIGFHNSVNSKYGRSFMSSLVSSYIKGKTVNEAFLQAKESVGGNDSAYKTGVDPVAEPLMRGNGSSEFLDGDYVTINVKIQNNKGEIENTVPVRVMLEETATPTFLSYAVKDLYKYYTLVDARHETVEEENGIKVAYMILI